MANLNKVFLMGNLTRDPELRYTPSGTAVCEFGLAINRQWTTPDGERRDETCFVDCQMWGRRGEVISEYLRKGNPLFVEGRLNFDQWEGRDGQRRSRLRVTCENFEFIGGGRGGRSDNEGAGGGPSRPPSGERGRPPRSQESPPPKEEVPPESSQEEDAGFDVKDDDIPF